MVGEIDWDALRAEAQAIAASGHAPYSQLHVGAAGLADDGRTIVGCNVENASYGLTLCAECGLVGALYAGGGGRLIAVTCGDDQGNRLTPCGRCRKLLFEAGGGSLLVDAEPEPRPLSELLPDAFGPDDLPDQDRR